MPIDCPSGDQNEYHLGEKMDTSIKRLPIQERLLIEQMEGVFPERANNLEGFTRILDVASGAGIWAVKVAQENPHLEVVGLERHSQLVQYATCLAKAQNVENVSFTLANENGPFLPFPDEHFDLVNARFLFTLLRKEEWPGFVREYLRVTRPGGYLRMIEPEWSKTKSPAFDDLKKLFLRGLKQRGYDLSPDENHIGAAFLLFSLLTMTGVKEISQRFSECTFWTVPRRISEPATWIEMLADSLEPLLLSTGVTTQCDFASLTRQIVREVSCSNFSEVAYVLSACGRKPETVYEKTRSAKEVKTFAPMMSQGDVLW